MSRGDEAASALGHAFDLERAARRRTGVGSRFLVLVRRAEPAAPVLARAAKQVDDDRLPDVCPRRCDRLLYPGQPLPTAADPPRTADGAQPTDLLSDRLAR